MATRESERKEAAYCFKTRYDALDELQTAVVAETAIAALLALDVSSAPPTAAQLNAAKLEYDAIRNSSVYENVTMPAMTNANLWAEIADEAAGGSSVCTTTEKYEAYYALSGKIADLGALKTAVQADGNISTLIAVDLSSATPTAAQLAAAKTAWDTFRSNSTYNYGGNQIPVVNPNAALWTEIATEASA
jgi:hypothetical protein